MSQSVILVKPSQVQIQDYAKMRKTSPQPYRLTFDDAIDVWLRHWRGEFQHHIAASFRVNPGRVNEVLREKKHIGSRQAAAQKRGAA